MKHFKKKLEDMIEMLTQPLWLNKNISINNDHIYYINYANKGIYLKDILNNYCDFLVYRTLNKTMI